eukprot:Amastigsp_a670_359.p2 type:complete len:164 gc:universal Amastigsp_a670_359:845-1336(+)
MASLRMETSSKFFRAVSLFWPHAPTNSAVLRERVWTPSSCRQAATSQPTPTGRQQASKDTSKQPIATDCSKPPIVITGPRLLPRRRSCACLSAPGARINDRRDTRHCEQLAGVSALGRTIFGHGYCVLGPSGTETPEIVRCRSSKTLNVPRHRHGFTRHHGYD